MIAESFQPRVTHAAVLAAMTASLLMFLRQRDVKFR